jgi:hypothetical protein
MIIFVPWLEICHLVVLFKFLELWKLVFGAKLVRCRFDSQWNFKFTPGPHVSLLPSLFWRTSRCRALLSRRCHALWPPPNRAVCCCAACTPHLSTWAAIESRTWPDNVSNATSHRLATHRSTGHCRAVQAKSTRARNRPRLKSCLAPPKQNWPLYSSPFSDKASFLLSTTPLPHSNQAQKWECASIYNVPVKTLSRESQWAHRILTFPQLHEQCHHVSSPPIHRLLWVSQYLLPLQEDPDDGAPH